IIWQHRGRRSRRTRQPRRSASGINRLVLIMRKNRNGNASANVKRLEKTPTGIVGFDEVTNGGVPKGRPTIVCGGPGCGKTMFAVEFLARGVLEYDEPGVLMTFEETSEWREKTVASLG